MGQAPSPSSARQEQHEAPEHSQVYTPQEAAAHIRELRKGVTLGGLKIKDLIHEGHKY